MQETYDPKSIEAAAQQHWQSTKAFEVKEDSARPKFYCLSMLPYPSGALHMGHVRNYTIGDVISRHRRMLGFNVMQPMGWDAFGLPAENAAIKNKTAPAKWTYANIDHMRSQLKMLGYAIDWSRELTTCKQEYYRWEQEFFVRLYKKGLVYRKNSVVNWDPVDQTVLANEQVVDGRGWRSGALVEKREIPQWFLKITDFAEDLLAGLDKLDGWPDAVKTMQRNWIGRSEGVEIDFTVADSEQKITVFTTRPDTLFGVTYLAVAAEHPIALAAAQSDAKLAAFIAECRAGANTEADLETQARRGVATNTFAVHPISGERLPIWVANFVLMSYGTGAVMAVPGHDERDGAFARSYNLPIKQVIEVPGESFDVGQWQDWYADKTATGLRLINSGEFDGLNFQQAFDQISDKLEKLGRAKRRVNYRLRDWGVSRQRYWGCPIPMMYDDKGEAHAVAESQLPVVLPEDVAFSGVTSPIKADPAWRQFTDADTGQKFERETDTFDTFMESSWYYARYCSPGADSMLDERAKYWLPVDQYIGGIEHAVMHLMYFRFFHRLMRDAGYVNGDEPATNLLCQGMVVAETFYREATIQVPDTGRHAKAGAQKSATEIHWFNPADVEVERDERGRVVGAKLRADGQPVSLGGIEKMSKSKNNGVDPQIMVDKFGADTVRLFSMFAAPPEQSLEWNEAGVEGMSRFLRRIWAQVQKHVGSAQSKDYDVTALSAEGKALRRQLHEVIQKVGDDYARRYAFNTAIASVMELSNNLAKFDEDSASAIGLRQEAYEAITLLLNPITPHICHQLWQELGHKACTLEDVPFPKADPEALQRDSVTLAIQVNGKLRGTLDIAITAEKSVIEAEALAIPNVQKFLEGQVVRKIIIVPGKIVNIVAN